MQTLETQRPNPNSKKYLTLTKCSLTRTSVLDTTSSAKLELAVGVILVTLSAAEALVALATSLKHFLEAVRRSAVVGNGNNRVHHAAKILRPQPKSHLRKLYSDAQLG
jgi:hypothetical protein